MDKKLAKPYGPCQSYAQKLIDQQFIKLFMNTKINSTIAKFFDLSTDNENKKIKKQCQFSV